jgi:hypothetical protein
MLITGHFEGKRLYSDVEKWEIGRSKANKILRMLHVIFTNEEWKSLMNSISTIFVNYVPGSDMAHYKEFKKKKTENKTEAKPAHADLVEELKTEDEWIPINSERMSEVIELLKTKAQAKNCGKPDALCVGCWGFVKHSEITKHTPHSKVVKTSTYYFDKVVDKDQVKEGKDINSIVLEKIKSLAGTTNLKEEKIRLLSNAIDLSTIPGATVKEKFKTSKVVYKRGRRRKKIVKK